jgi:integrase
MTPSRFASKKYPNLYRLPSSKNWVFRKYSKTKGKEFYHSTGESKSEANAYAIGLAAYHEWLGLKDSGKENPRFDAYVDEMLARKLALPDADFSPNSKRSFRNSIMHLRGAFGHLRLDQVDEDRWEEFYSESLQLKPGQKFFNRRKTLIEVMRKAQRDGFIKRLPEFKNPDPETNAGQYLSDETVEKILAAAAPQTRLLIEIMWRQGARPGEVLQYRWDMIRWNEGKHGAIHIPPQITKTRRDRTIPLNPRVAQLLRAAQSQATSPYVFPSPKAPSLPMASYKTAWNAACRRAGVTADIYDLRRTFISNQAKKGSPIVYVAKYVDSSVTMIERFYAKVNLDVFGGISG